MGCIEIQGITKQSTLAAGFTSRDSRCVAAFAGNCGVIWLMKYLCESCNHSFNAQEAKCIDWREHEKSFACPNCELCLERPSLNYKALFYGAVTSVAASLAAKFSIDFLFRLNEVLGYVSSVLVLAGIIFVVHKYSQRQILVRPYPDQCI